MKLEYRYGLYAALGLIVWELGEWLLGFHGERIAWQADAAVLSLVVPAFFVYLGVRTRRDVLQGGYLTLRDGLYSAFWITAVYTLFSTLFMALYLTFVNPQFLEIRSAHAREKRYEQLRQDPKTSESQARRLADEAHPTPGAGSSLMAYATVRVSQGILLGLIVTLLLRKERIE